jgi:hypothetical protein
MADGLAQLVREVEDLVDRYAAERERPRRFRRFEVHRAGQVLASGVELPSGRTVMEWGFAPDLQETHHTIERVELLHNTGGTTLVFLDL